MKCLICNIPEFIGSEFFPVYLKYSWLVYKTYTSTVSYIDCCSHKSPSKLFFSAFTFIVQYNTSHTIRQRQHWANFFGQKNPSTWLQIVAFCITALEDDTFSHNSDLAFKSCLNQVNLIHDLAVKNGRIKRRLKQPSIKAKWFWQKNRWLAESLWHFSSSYPKN